MSSQAPVSLVHVDEDTINKLVHAALTDADANEVTPPIEQANRWSPVRVAWLRSFHRDRRPGLDGPLAEETWAIVEDGHVQGSLRLKRTADPTSLELGVWLTRSARGRGVGTRAVGRGCVSHETMAPGRSSPRRQRAITALLLYFSV